MTTALRHPLNVAGQGQGPFSCWTSIRLPLLSLALCDPAVMERRRRRIESESRLFHVQADRCTLCQRQQDTLYVVSDVDMTHNIALCRECLEGTGDPALTRKAFHLDREHDRLTEQCTRRPWRTRR